MLRMTRLLPTLAAVALLAACAAPQNGEPQSIAQKTNVELPQALQPATGADPDFETAAAWSDGTRDSFVVVVYGSSTCAPIATKLSKADEKTLALEFEYAQGSDAPCTADMAANSYLLESPQGVAADGDVALDLTFRQDGESTTSTVTILD